jgi:hypothetical protein
MIACPACGGVLERVTDGEIAIAFAPAFHRRDQPIPYKLVARPFLACSACEHCEPIRSSENVRSRRTTF